MTRLSKFRLGRALAVALLLTAWFAMSNHCALAFLAGVPTQTASDVQKDCCPSQDAGGERQPASSPNGVCCKSLRVVLTDGAAKLVEARSVLPTAELVWVEIAVLSAPEGLRPLELAATGPPEVRSFAEVVLQGSLLAHAPPFAV